MCKGFDLDDPIYGVAAKLLDLRTFGFEAVEALLARASEDFLARDVRYSRDFYGWVAGEGVL
ncbi:hypothetical protein C6N40_03075 [Arenimonas caeni]|uniref:Uncharacterized protein n=2 Tax=Arenimonas caeni TaxID=2058085 RepID=A0A2P6MAZ2_9GAMM|nr:hypothetical protein C6N40_03075 [Arenimonas caeni]